MIGSEDIEMMTLAGYQGDDGGDEMDIYIGESKREKEKKKTTAVMSS